MGSTSKLTEVEVKNHVLRPSFGLQYDDVNPELKKLFSKIEKVGNLTAQAILRENYNEAFNIYSHTTAVNAPMALVTAHPVEEVTELSALYNRIRRYRLHNIYDVCKQNLSEFLENPKHINDLLFDIAGEELPKKNSTAAELIALLEKQTTGKV